MILLTFGVLIIIPEILLLLVLMAGIIAIEYSLLKKTGIRKSSIIKANFLSMAAGILLSNTARRIVATFINDGQKTNPFAASLAYTSYWYEGNIFIVLFIILAFDFIFSVLVEYFYYRYHYTMDSPGLIFRKTLYANGISYLGVTLIAVILIFLCCSF